MKKTITAKFISIVAGCTVILMLILAFVILSTANQSQIKQTQGFIKSLREEEVNQEKLLKKALVTRAKAIADLLAENGANLIIGYDFEALNRLAQSALKEKDIVAVHFHDKTNKLLTQQMKINTQEGEKITQPIVFENAVIGSVEIDLDYVFVKESIQQLSKRINNIVSEADLIQKSSYKKILFSIVFILIVGVLALCFIIFKSLIMIITKPIADVVYVTEEMSQGHLNKRFLETVQTSCAKLKNCNNTDCPSHPDSHEYKRGACWLVAGSSASEIKCPAILKGKANGGLDSCEECHVYQSMNLDEIQVLSRSLNMFIVNLHKMIKTITNQADKLNSSSSQLSIISSQMDSSADKMASKASNASIASENVTHNVGSVATTIEQSSVSVSNIADITDGIKRKVIEMSDFAQKTANNVHEMAQSSADMSHEINNIAAAIEEMTVSLNEVAKNTADANTISQNAKSQTNEIRTRMNALVKASKQIGKVVSVIKDIADQTNMLALNATIEAAGAGDAGKGFAVVAGEVKELAKQSADATDEIAEQIAAIQKTTDEAVASINQVSQIIDKTATISHIIASAVEEQTATANEISKTIAKNAQKVKIVAENANESASLVSEIAKTTDETSKTIISVALHVEELNNGVKDVASSSAKAAHGVQDISNDILEISQMLKEMAVGTEQTTNASTELAGMAKMLLELVSKFKL
ncbi:MAG: hypothetical protein HQK77_14075 [Desulfobacterales bacterium]|nr:hypothetical protein [Desulfobacterales bacterium]